MDVNIEKVFTKMKDRVEQFQEDNPHIKSFILGVSGGIDSAMVAAIVNAAIRDRKLKIKLLGYSIPGDSNKKDEVDRAFDIGGAFCDEIHYDEDFLQVMYNAYVNWVKSTGYIGSWIDLQGFPMDKVTLDEKIRLGNIKARLRMIHLYDMARMNDGVVLSTDNFTEYMLGFWTLHGDVGDFGIIQNLWKSEVYKITEFLIEEFNNVGFHNGADALKKCASAVPTDGLGITNSDFDQLGAGSYGEIDQILMTWIFRMEGWENYKDHPVIKRHQNSVFKRENPLNVAREEIGLGNAWLMFN